MILLGKLLLSALVLAISLIDGYMRFTFDFMAAIVFAMLFLGIATWAWLGDR